MLLIIVLWFGISAPLSAIGSYFGYKIGVKKMHLPAWLILIRFFQAVRHPVRVNQIPRQIPPGPKYLKPWVGFLFIYKRRPSIN
jgi:transmembrane 9 superfamily protein 2/4